MDKGGTGGMKYDTQQDAPLLEAMQTHRLNRVVRFDVPGHKGGRGNHELVDFLGSDCHGTRFRPLHVGESLSWMIREVKPGEVQRILETNIEKILRNE